MIKASESGTIRIRRFTPDDAAAVSELVQRNFREVNSRDYPQAEMARLAELHSPARVMTIGENTHFYVACVDEKIVGCGAAASVAGRPGECHLQTIFVLPEWQGSGVGRKILAALEDDETARSANRIVLHASITAHEFYVRCGYADVAGRRELDENGLYPMEKIR